MKAKVTTQTGRPNQDNLEKQKTRVIYTVLKDVKLDGQQSISISTLKLTYSLIHLAVIIFAKCLKNKIL